LTPSASATAVEPRVAVTYAYCLVLGRNPDGAGLNSYASRIAEGMQPSQLLVEMLNSEEFAAKHNVLKLSTKDYVRLMHRLLLGLEPGEPALTDAAAVIEGKKQVAELQRALIESAPFRSRHPTLFGKVAAVPAVEVKASAPPEVSRNCDLNIIRRPLEFERGQVIYGYCLVLGRWPDGAGLASWTAGRRGGVSLEGFLTGLLQSQEFTARYKTDGLDDAGFVTLHYRLLLARNPNPEELNKEGSRLSYGQLSRAQFVSDILASEEFRKKQDALFTARMPEKARAEAE
jgi:hypothetical protein